MIFRDFTHVRKSANSDRSPLLIASKISKLGFPIVGFRSISSRVWPSRRSDSISISALALLSSHSASFRSRCSAASCRSLNSGVGGSCDAFRFLLALSRCARFRSPEILEEFSRLSPGLLHFRVSATRPRLFLRLSCRPRLPLFSREPRDLAIPALTAALRLELAAADAESPSLGRKSADFDGSPSFSCAGTRPRRSMLILTP
mmetsp:Transcript_10342/g.24781  ORF Transcript_10342/g.24781 Transcript_10342/m.24781 type:complete len:203 (-) Transcript_10342:96-704(-)